MDWALIGQLRDTEPLVRHGPFLKTLLNVFMFLRNMVRRLMISVLQIAPLSKVGRDGEDKRSRYVRPKRHLVFCSLVGAIE